MSTKHVALLILLAAACGDRALTAQLPDAPSDLSDQVADQDAPADQPATAADINAQMAGEDVVPAPADTPVDMVFFYTSLGSYGHWTLAGPYGWVWLPY